MYRVVKHVLQPFDNWNPVTIYLLQYTAKNESWYTLNASSSLADIKHACHEGNNHEQKFKAYQNFLKGL